MEKKQDYSKLKAYRRDLHKIPEIGDDLMETKEYILEVLQKLDCKLIPVMNTGLVAFFDKGKEATVAFRTDMDALPIREGNIVDYKSRREGRMHACGHDGHMAMCLRLAEYVNLLGSGQIKNNVLIIFQPAEETTGGAEHVVKTGILQEVNTKGIFGIHLWPFVEKGQIASKPGEMMAMSAELYIEIIGKKAHAAKADDGIDGIETMAGVLSEVYPMSKDGILRLGKVRGGEACNILADRVTMEGTIRSLREEGLENIKKQLLDICEKWQKKTGATINVRVNNGYPPVVNSHELYACMDGFFHREGIVRLEEPLMISEDFSYYGKAVPSIFFFLGTGTKISLHSEVFDFDEEILCKGLDLYKKIIELGM